MTPEIRAATADDLEAILRIERESFGDPWEPEVLLRDLTQPLARFTVLYAAELGVVGFCDAWILFDELEVHDIAVAVDQRGQGYGRLLIQHALGLGRAAGVRRALLDVRESNAAALRLYQGLGFVVVGRRRRYYRLEGEDALTMALELA